MIPTVCEFRRRRKLILRYKNYYTVHDTLVISIQRDAYDYQPSINVNRLKRLVTTQKQVEGDVSAVQSNSII